ncbi:MAG: tRNA threonylcarbamoyladenosine dehydratase [Treponema sp.]|jgi:tRNA A37 threonylcarbamoyladenosine dehydratase|nr:tRNA threonylcarbamoyladenosine dehydratase [Treponema sp.]
MPVDPRFQRLTPLAGVEAVTALAETSVVIIGLGGVGSWCAEALARSGVGKFTIADSDTVCITNINRQIHALNSTIGQSKACVMAERIKEINPACEVRALTETFFLPERCREGFAETARRFGIDEADYVIDAIDSLKCKLDLIETAATADKILFSSMGMAQRLDPSQIRCADIWKTSGCPLAKNVRHGLKERGFNGHFTAVYSAERIEPMQGLPDPEPSGKKAMGSAVTVTASAGLFLASLVIRNRCARINNTKPAENTP